MKQVTITAKTVEEAVEKGIRQLGISRAEAIVHVDEEPSSGLFGLIRKKPAVVTLSAPEAKNEEPRATEEPRHVEEVAPEEETGFPDDAEAIEEEPEAEAARADKKEVPYSREEQDEVAEEARKFLAHVFEGMHIEVTMEKLQNEERILFNLHGDNLGILIGKHGQTLDALQYLINLAAGKLHGHRYFILLDVENYRERRAATLEGLAKRLADKAHRTGRPVKLEPMSAAERRIIHLALQAEPDVETQSEGEAPNRYIVIRSK
ncbi:MAG: RNA-binding cell elongation regulator Jag/EloR [Dialister sp.]|nr:RNA-binding cell elongation regulator Jag/EloR [Dialister sp.]